MVSDRWGRDLILDEPRLAGGSLFALFSTPLQCDLNGDGIVGRFRHGNLVRQLEQTGLGRLEWRRDCRRGRRWHLLCRVDGDPAPVPSVAVPPVAVPEPSQCDWHS